MDAERMRAESLQAWDGVAPAWERFADTIRRQTAPVSKWMLSQLDAERPSTILELACGTADLTLQIAQRLPPSTRFICSDFAPQMLSAAEKRTRAAGFDTIELRILDAHALDLDDASVDAVVCRFGYMLMPEVDLAFKETARVLRDDGRVVLATWGPLERNAWLLVFGGALMQYGYMPGDDPYGPGGIFSLSDPGLVKTKLEAAGLRDARVEEIAFNQSFPDFDNFWDTQSQLAGRAAHVLASVDEQTRTQIKETARELAREFTSDEGVRLPALALGATARK